MRSILFALLFAAAPSAATSGSPRRVEVVTWFAMTPPQLGCWLEKPFGHRDPKWNCDLKDWKTSGDPCKNSEPYYEGPQIPEAIAKRIDSRLSRIQLEWEHGDLRSVNFEFGRRISEKDARRAFRLPGKGAPEGFQSVSFQPCSKKGPCLLVEKFEHMGAGEAGCGEAPSEGRE